MREELMGWGRVPVALALGVFGALVLAHAYQDLIWHHLPKWSGREVVAYLLYGLIALYLGATIGNRQRWAVLRFGWVIIPLLAGVFAWLCWRLQIQLLDWEKHTPLGRAELALGSVALLVLVPRFLHLCMVAVRRSWGALSWAGRKDVDPGHFESALPSHQNVVERLVSESGACPKSPAMAYPKTIALRGCWGAGKTACLRLFQARTQKSGTAALVWFDCWRHQSESQPEFTLYWAAAQEWSVLWPWGWLQVPVLRAYLTWLPLIIKATWKLGPMEMSLDDKALKDPPRALFWQRHLEGLVRHALIRRRRVVIVLEDIDRCAAVAAQRYVTLIRRFLAVPGVTIIIPHVEDQLRIKVFDPMNAQLPDLAATTTAALWSAFGKSALDEATLDRIGKLAESGGDTAELANDNLMRAIRPSLLRRLAEAPETVRHQLYAVLEDKYLCDQVIVLPPLNAEDCASLVVSAAKGRMEWGRIAEEYTELKSDIRSHLHQEIFAQHPGGTGVMARQFSGALSQLLNEVGGGLDTVLPLVMGAFNAGRPQAAAHLLALFGYLAHQMAVARTETALSAKDAPPTRKPAPRKQESAHG